MGGGQLRDPQEGTGLGGLPLPCGALGGEPEQAAETYILLR